jgi:hypothetical protein
MRVTLLVVSFISSLLLSQWPVVASAHIFREDNGIKLELHIPPNDRPTPTTPTQYVLSFEDEPKGFNLTHYKLGATFSDENATFAHHVLEPTTNEEVKDTIRFPKAGNYTIQVDGQSTLNKKDTFTTSFPVRVVAAKSSQKISSSVWVTGGVGIALIIGIAMVLERKTKKPTSQQ